MSENPHNPTTESDDSTDVSRVDDTGMKISESKLPTRARVDDAMRRQDSSRLESDPSKSSYAGYLFGSSGTLDRPAWSDTMHGRALIRLFSRGIVGAAAFTWGGYFARKQMRNYEPEVFRHQLSEWKGDGKVLQAIAEKPLQFVAYGLDHFPGGGIKKLARLASDPARKEYAAYEATRFRFKAFYHDRSVWQRPPFSQNMDFMRHGRSYGSEVVGITFDFFMASIGDALTRNVIQAFDPNVKQPWLLDENGRATVRSKKAPLNVPGFANGDGKEVHFDPSKWLQAVGRASWRVLTKNAGEDWFAGLFYVYQMKWQRQLISKLPGAAGFKLSADPGMNGAVARVNREGEITGSYQLEGALDLHTRFVGYNWYTLMYREMYDRIARGFQRWGDNHYEIKAPNIGNPITAAVDTAGFAARYVMKSFIKANLYMQPAVIPFWLMRTPQTKWRGAYVFDEAAQGRNPNDVRNAYITQHPTPNGSINRMGEVTFPYNTLDGHMPRTHLIHGNYQTPKVVYAGTMPIHAPQNPGVNNIFRIQHPYEMRQKRTPFHSVLNLFGAASYHSGSGLTRLADAVSPITGSIMKGGKLLSEQERLLGRETKLRNFVDASFSYTPYMWAKAETALRVDDRKSVEELGHMDKAIYRFLDGMFTFNAKTMGDALKDIGQLGMHIERDVISREGSNDVSVGDGTTIPRPGNKQDKVETPATRIDTKTVERTHEPTSLSRANDNEAAANENHPDQGWAESVAGRKLESQFQAPSKSIH